VEKAGVEEAEEVEVDEEHHHPLTQLNSNRYKPHLTSKPWGPYHPPSMEIEPKESNSWKK
jgi:hypothetical protein